MPNKTLLLTGQILLIVCFTFYLVWWYRGFRPGVSVSRVKGMNGLLLLITAVAGLAGLAMSLIGAAPGVTNPVFFFLGGLVGYILLLLVTRFLFNRIVTSELLLIVVWTVLELYVAGRSPLSIGIIAAAFLVSIVCYIAYYRMEEMKAFYTAMVPLIAAIVCMVTVMFT